MIFIWLKLNSKLWWNRNFAVLTSAAKIRKTDTSIDLQNWIEWIQNGIFSAMICWRVNESWMVQKNYSWFSNWWNIRLIWMTPTSVICLLFAFDVVLESVNNLCVVKHERWSDGFRRKCAHQSNVFSYRIKNNVVSFRVSSEIIILCLH